MTRAAIAIFLAAVSLGACVTEGPQRGIQAREGDVPTPVEKAHSQVEQWIEDLEHTFGKDRLARIQALIGYKELALEPILARLPDARPEVRANLVYVLGYIGGPEAHQALLSSLGAEEPAVRYEAAAALVSVGDWSGVPVLIDFMDSDDRRMRYKSFEILKDKTREDFGYRFSAPPPEREKAVGRWRSWWKDRRSAIIYGRR